MKNQFKTQPTNQVLSIEFFVSARLRQSKLFLQKISIAFISLCFIQNVNAQIANAPCNTKSTFRNGIYSNLSASRSVGGICLPTTTGATSNLIDADTTNFAGFSITGLGCSVTYAVVDGDAADTYPAGTYAGFKISSANLLSVGVASNVRIETYNNGSFVEGQDVVTSLIGIDASLLDGNGNATLGFITTAGFDEVRIKYTTLVGALFSAQVYYPVIEKFCAGTALSCNAQTQMNNTTYPTIIETSHTGVNGVACVGCSINNTENIISSSTTDYSTITLAAVVGTTASVAVKDVLTTYPANTFAGFNISNSGLIGANVLSGITIKTYLNGTLQQTSNSGTLVSVGSSLLTGTTDQLVGMVASSPFNEVRFEISNLLGVISTTKVYNAVFEKFCAGPALVCNTQTQMNNTTYPTIVEISHTGISGVACVGCSVDNAVNLISASTSDYATINLTAAVGTVGSVAVKDVLTTYPAGTLAGFNISNSNLVNANALSGIVLKTYLNGTLQEVSASGTLLSVNSVLLTGTVDQLVAMVTTLPFNEVKLEVTNLLGVINTTKVYNAVFESFCNGPALTCSNKTYITNPTYPVIIDNTRTGIAGAVCVGCAVDNASNVIDNSATNYARITLVAGVLSSGSIAVKSVGQSYAAGTFAGFDIRNATLVGINLLSNATITTYLNGSLQETSGGNILSLELLTADRQIAGFVTTLPFDEVKVTVANVVGVDVGITDVFGLVLRGTSAAGLTAPTLTGGNASNYLVKTNTCPSLSVNLNSLVSSSAPSGARLIWSTHQTPTSVADTLTTAQANAITTTGKYYGMYTASGCYSQADSVQVNIISCVNAVTENGTAPATGGTAVANVAANDIVNGVTATLGGSGNATVSQVGTWQSGITLNTSTGAVVVASGTPVGNYPLTYQLCDRLTPTTCATVVDTIKVIAVINPVTENGSVAATGGTAIVNVAANDLVNGNAATLGGSGNATISQSGTWQSGITLNTNTGAITVAAGTPVGNYPLTYQLCDKLTPVNCATIVDTIKVTAIVNPVAETGTIPATGGTAIANVTTNDFVNGNAATLGGSGNATISQIGTWQSGITLNTTTGAITVAAGTAVGNYTVTYQLCDKLIPNNCASVVDTIRVTSIINPVTENGTVPATGGTAIANVTTNDFVNGNPATLGVSGNATISQSGTWQSGIILNTTTGAITVAAGTAVGNYPVAYQLCDKLIPSNCATVVDTIKVTAVVVANTENATVTTDGGNAMPNVLTNDVVNGNPATVGAGGNATISQSGSWPSGITLNTTTGYIVVAIGTAVGSYPVAYQLCDKLTPTTCSTVIDTVKVVTPTDTDGDGVPDNQEIADGTNPNDNCSFNYSHQVLTPNSAWNNADCDGDGVINGTEKTDGTNPLDGCSYNATHITLTRSASWNAGDCDNDGLNNGAEITAGTDPLNPDTDGDGVNDGTEVADGTNPLDGCSYNAAHITLTRSASWNALDCDNDGLSNGNEVAIGTDPRNPDTDGDGVIDGTEVTDNTNPLNPCSYVAAHRTVAVTVNCTVDTDGDGVNDAQEIIDGTNPLDGCSYNAAHITLTRSTIWNNMDCDGDGVKNGTEVTDGTNPLDGCSYNAAHITLAHSISWNLLDCDNDDLPNIVELGIGTDPLNPDTDGDGVIDGTEVTDGTNPLDGCSYNAAHITLGRSVSWNSLDCDNDGLNNGMEISIGTNPLNPDTDGDGVIDGTEVADGTNPLDGCSYNAAHITLAPSIAWKLLDCDNDGLNNGGEIIAGTDPKHQDTDGDGVKDGTEVIDGTNALDGCSYNAAHVTLSRSISWNALDCDNDGLNNGTEVSIGTDPQNPDTDGDGVKDGTEVIDGTNPSNACSYIAAHITLLPNLSWSNLDCDGDGVKNGTEVIDGTNPQDACSYIASHRTMPVLTNCISDTDGDGVTNAQEVIDGTDPNDFCSYNPASVTQARSAGWNTADCDGDGVTNGTEIIDGTNPLNGCSYNALHITLAHSIAWNLLDCDNDGLNNGAEIIAGTNPQNPDTDGDGVKDGTEVTDLTNPLDPCSYNAAHITLPVTVICSTDTDGDGVTDSQEIIDGTNPNDFCSYNPLHVTQVRSAFYNAADCDGDGVINGTEITDGTNPLDPCSYNATHITLARSASWNLLDCDGDGVKNETEVTDGTNPQDNCSRDTAHITLPITQSCNVTSGGGGGVESKTLGDVISQRLYGNAVNNIVEVNGYNGNVKFVNSGTIVNGVNDLTLNMLMPTTVANTDAAYVSTPTDLVNFTNAIEVLSVDYSKNSNTRAVAFATKTLTDVYSHTKPICDRLKGAELLEVKNITVNGFNLIAYKVRQRTGEIEFAANLSAGTTTNRNSISLQSNWFTDSYIQDEKLYNFQLWAISYDMVTSMATDIITKLQANGTVNNVTSADLPKAYISKGNRSNTNLNLMIQNNTANTNGYFELREKANENSQVVIRQVAFTVQPFNQSAIQVPVKDNYEGNVYVYLNNKLTDLVYLSDGTWSLDYNKSTTTISKFNVTNESNLVNNSGEYRLFRNVEVAGVAKDFITIYKTIAGGGVEQNLANNKALIFNASASGAGTVTVTLIKKSITNWNQQYNYTINLDGDKEYAINFSDFKSSKFNTAITANDITAISFSFNNSKTVAATMKVDLSKVRFTSSVVNNNLDLQVVSVFPNPTVNTFTTRFTSNTNQSIVLKVVEISTGKVVKTQFINATKGNNQVAVSLGNSLVKNGTYIVNLEGDGVKYNPTKLMVNNK